MKELFPRTSLSIDEAVANMLGWFDGPASYRSFNKTPTDDENELLDSLEFCLQDQLIEDKESSESDLAEAAYDKQPAPVIANLRRSVDRHDAEISLAKMYREEIEDELSRGPNSVLLVDPALSTTNCTYIRRTSFDQWLSQRNGANPEPRRKMLDQQDAILTTIIELGHDPKMLPKPRQGKPGVKAEVKKVLAKNPLFTGKTAFDNAWDTLRSECAIMD